MSSSSTSTVDFLSDIPADKKELLELTYNIYITSWETYKDSNNPDKLVLGAGAFILDNKNTPFNLKVCVAYDWVTEENHPSLAKTLRTTGSSQDIEYNKTVMKDHCAIMSLQMALRYVEKLLNPTTKEYVTVNLYTSHTYLTNVLKEWMHFWKPENFHLYPNEAALTAIYPFVVALGNRFNVYWKPVESDDHFKEVLRLQHT